MAAAAQSQALALVCLTLFIFSCFSGVGYYSNFNYSSSNEFLQIYKQTCQFALLNLRNCLELIAA